jgi:PAS domain-containing protein
MNLGVREGLVEAALPDRLVEAIYEAALDSTAWPDALELVSAQFRGITTRIVVWDLQEGSMLPGIRYDFAIDVGTIAPRSTVAGTSPMLRFAMRIPLHKAVDQAQELGGIDSFKLLDIYADAYRPQRHMPMLGTVLIRNPRMLAGLSFFRPDHWPLADAADMVLGERISRHVGRAMELGRLLARDQAPSSFEAALGAAPAPILLLNGAQEIVWINIAAEELLRTGDGLKLERRMLIATDRCDNERLARALALTAGGATAALMVQRAAQPSPFILRLLPLPRSQAAMGARILVQIAEPETHRRFDPAEAVGLST